MLVRLVIQLLIRHSEHGGIVVILCKLLQGYVHVTVPTNKKKSITSTCNCTKASKKALQVMKQQKSLLVQGAEVVRAVVSFTL